MAAELAVMLGKTTVVELVGEKAAPWVALWDDVWAVMRVVSKVGKMGVPTGDWWVDMSDDVWAD